MPNIIKRILQFLGWTLLVSGVLMALFGCIRAVGGVTTWVGGESAEGVVTSIQEERRVGPSNKNSYGEYSVITFRTADGRVVTFRHPMGGNSAPYSMQERVRVVYDADAPEDAVVPGGLAFLTAAWMFLFVTGVVLVIAGAGVLVLGALPWQARPRSGPTIGQATSPIDGAVKRFARLAIAAIQKSGRRF